MAYFSPLLVGLLTKDDFSSPLRDCNGRTRCHALAFISAWLTLIRGRNTQRLPLRCSSMFLWFLRVGMPVVRNRERQRSNSSSPKILPPYRTNSPRAAAGHRSAVQNVAAASSSRENPNSPTVFDNPLGMSLRNHATRNTNSNFGMEFMANAGRNRGECGMNPDFPIAASRSMGVCLLGLELLQLFATWFHPALAVWRLWSLLCILKNSKEWVEKNQRKADWIWNVWFAESVNPDFSLKFCNNSVFKAGLFSKLHAQLSTVLGSIAAKSNLDYFSKAVRKVYISIMLNYIIFRKQPEN